MDGSSLVDAHTCVGAIIVTADRRYLMQLRDDIPHIRFPGTWGLFGGSIEPGEGPELAVLRELQEELEFDVRDFQPAHELKHAEDGGAVRRKFFFRVPVTADQIASFVQHEGADMRLFTYAELMELEKVIPYDRAAIVFDYHRE